MYVFYFLNDTPCGDRHVVIEKALRQKIIFTVQDWVEQYKYKLLLKENECTAKTIDYRVIETGILPVDDVADFVCSIDQAGNDQEF